MATNREQTFHDVLKEHFDRVWKRNAALGLCDALGSSEYERVWHDFQRDFHTVISTFIFEGANEGS